MYKNVVATYLHGPLLPKNPQVCDYLLEKANVLGTPGSGFGPSGEGYFRLTAFGSYENTVEAIERIKRM